jgi:hypothetical protein
MGQGLLRRAVFFGAALLVTMSANAALLVDRDEIARLDPAFEDQALRAARAPDEVSRELFAPPSGADSANVWSLTGRLSGVRGGELRALMGDWAPRVSATAGGTLRQPSVLNVPSPVPLPDALWLFASGTAGLWALRYRRRA